MNTAQNMAITTKRVLTDLLSVEEEVLEKFVGILGHDHQPVSEDDKSMFERIEKDICMTVEQSAPHSGAREPRDGAETHSPGSLDDVTDVHDEALAVGRELLNLDG